MGRRANGEGSIFKLSDGRWAGEVSWSDPGDKSVRPRRIKKRVYGHSQAEVREKLDEVRARVGGPVSEEQMGGFLDRWLEQCVRPHREPRTVASYEYVLTKQLKPYLQNIPLRSLTKADVEQWLKTFGADITQRRADLSAKGLKGPKGDGSRTKQYAFSILKAALNWAANDLECIPVNPCTKIKAPTVKKQKRLVWDVEDAKRFLTHVKEESDLYPLFELTLCTGMRWEEVAGLWWMDVDTVVSASAASKWRVSVARTLTEVNGKIVGYGPPKSQAGSRSIELGHTATEALKKHRVDQMALGRVAKDRPVFTDTEGNPMHHRVFYHRYLKLLKKAGVPKITFHDLRHTVATLLLKSGENPRVVQERLGHSNVELTLGTYSHVLPTMQAEASNKLDEMLNGVQK